MIKSFRNVILLALVSFSTEWLSPVRVAGQWLLEPIPTTVDTVTEKITAYLNNSSVYAKVKKSTVKRGTPVIFRKEKYSLVTNALSLMEIEQNNGNSLSEELRVFQIYKPDPGARTLFENERLLIRTPLNNWFVFQQDKAPRVYCTSGSCLYFKRTDTFVAVMALVGNQPVIMVLPENVDKRPDVPQNVNANFIEKLPVASTDSVPQLNSATKNESSSTAPSQSAKASADYSMSKDVESELQWADMQKGKQVLYNAAPFFLYGNALVKIRIGNLPQQLTKIYQIYFPQRPQESVTTSPEKMWPPTILIKDFLNNWDLFNFESPFLYCRSTAFCIGFNVAPKKIQGTVVFKGEPTILVYPMSSDDPKLIKNRNMERVKPLPQQ